MSSNQYISTHFKNEAREYFNRKLQAYLKLRRESVGNKTFRFEFEFLTSSDKDCSTIVYLFMDENGEEILKKSVRILTDETLKNLPMGKRDDNVVAFKNQEDYETQTSIQFKDCFDEDSEEKLSKYRKEAKLLTKCLDKNFWDLSLDIDDFIGMPISKETAKWNHIHAFGASFEILYRSAVLAMFLWGFYPGIRDDPKNVVNYVVAICVSLFAAWVAGFIWNVLIRYIACSSMPVDFYEKSPRGRLVLHDSQYKSAAELKSKSLLWSGLFFLIAIALLLIRFAI